ncbi:hypothetical protein [Brevibacillus laterosporus]|uniref:hypothetical protein n=1 Tax=Brevibacillus laterosporus TaxID=1465 RepID=UPI0018F88FF6|nr:hypothetical protein [Brevibacillus laterosporus]MBG9774241.1 hypothetical protein [Brevibacillus laterosporus]
MEFFNSGVYGEDWYENIYDFMSWLDTERKRCIPTGPCGQDVATTSGLRGLMGKYPTFKDAYSEYIKVTR